LGASRKALAASSPSPTPPGAAMLYVTQNTNKNMSQTRTPRKTITKNMPLPFIIMIDHFEEEKPPKKA
jgi:hypothetical protein